MGFRCVKRVSGAHRMEYLHSDCFPFSIVPGTLLGSICAS